MPTPDFVAGLRAKVGTDLLPLVGTTAVVRNTEGCILLGLRSDTRDWALPSGILEPFEEPAHGLRREVLEECGVTVEVLALAAVSTTDLVTYPNGDRSVYLDLTFLCRHLEGEAHVADDENLEVGWFHLRAMPTLRVSSQQRLERALAFDGTTWFAR